MRRRIGDTSSEWSSYTVAEFGRRRYILVRGENQCPTEVPTLDPPVAYWDSTD
jgi:hypothetical protein